MPFMSNHFLKSIWWVLLSYFCVFFLKICWQYTHNKWSPSFKPLYILSLLSLRVPVRRLLVLVEYTFVPQKLHLPSFVPPLGSLLLTSIPDYKEAMERSQLNGGSLAATPTAFMLYGPQSRLASQYAPWNPKPSLVSQHAWSIMSDISIYPVITTSAWDCVWGHD